MNLALWIVAALLAAAYLFSGVGKLIMSKEKIAAMSHGTGWVEDFSPGALKIIGVLEVLAAVGSGPARRIRHCAGAGSPGRGGSGVAYGWCCDHTPSSSRVQTHVGRLGLSRSRRLRCVGPLGS